MKYFQAMVLIFLIILTIIIPFYRGGDVKSFNSLAMPPMMGNESLSWKFVPQGINIYAIYSSEPAPMGIADYGIGPNGPYILTTNSWKGVVYLNSVNVNTSIVGFQLNVNLYYTYNDHQYDLWVQDVAVLNVTNNTLFFVNNIWNSTARNANVTGVIGNGRIYYNNSSHTTFYAYLAWNSPGSPKIISFPTTFQLKVDVTTNSQGEPVICFYYNDGYGWVEYDIVTVINAPGASNVYFMVNGYEYNGYGTYFDAELVMVGPGGGHTAYVYSADVGLQLFYWNGHNYQEIKNAYDFGSDTAEKLYNAYVYPAYFTYTGELLSVIISGSGTLGQLWNQNSVEVVQVNSPVYSGYAKIYNFSIPFSDSYTIQGFNFTGGEFIQTLVPTMQYSILVYSSPNGTLEDEGYAPPKYGYVVVNAERFSITPSQYNISLSRSESTTLTLNIIGEGPVYFNLFSPIPASLSNYFENLTGTGSDTLYITAPSQPGTYTIYVYGNFLNGYIIEVQITVSVTVSLVTVTFNVNVIGQPLPSSPTLTLDFPNGTITTLPLSSGLSLELPYGTTYNIQQTIGEGNIRWSLPSPVQGTIVSSTTISVTYYQQFLVTFTFAVQGGNGYPSPSVTYIYFGLSTTITAPSTVWVDANTQYTYQSILQGNNERWIDFSPSGEVTSPGTISAYYYNEYYVTVNSPIPVYAIVNGTEMELKTGWYIQGTTVNIINQTYQVSQGERYVISSVSPSTSFTIESPLTVTVSIITQYYITVNSEIPVFAIINGENTTFSSNWYNAGTKITIENITYYPSAGIRFIITSIVPYTTFTVSSPLTVTINVLEQFYVTVNSPIPIYAIVNTTNVSLRSGWYNAETKIQVENITYYLNSETRYVIVKLPQLIILTSPEVISIGAIEQFYVKVYSILPVYAIVNNTNQSLTSGWYNKGTIIHVENLTYYISKYERYIMVNVSPSTKLNVLNPLIISVSFMKQYFISVNSLLPIYAFINGTNMTLLSGWYNVNTKVQIENLTYYLTPGERYVMTYVSLKNFTLSSPINITAEFLKQYYITVNSPMPVKALINDSEEVINSSWINADTSIQVINYTYYPNNEERLVPVYLPPKIVVKSSITIKVKAEVQYLVTINGISNWYNKGSIIVLNANVPFYMVGEFIGTYNVSPGSSIIVNGPIQETLVEHINYIVVGLIGGIIILVIAIIALALRSRK